jgi:hypothetical protein
MPTTSEVSTRLTADNSQYRSVMNQSVAAADTAGKSILKKLDVKAGTLAIAAAVGFNLQSIAEGLARRVIGFSKSAEEALERTVEATKKAADEQEKALEKARAAREKAEEESAERATRQAEVVMRARLEFFEAEARAKKDADERALAIEEKAWEEKEKRVKENREMLVLEAKAITGLTTEEKKRLEILKLQAKQKGINAEIDALLLKKTQWGLTPAEQKRLNILIKQTGEIESQISAVDKVADATKKIAPAVEEAKTANDSFVDSMDALFNKTDDVVKKWKEFQAITTTGRGDKDLTDAELERKINQIEQDIFRRQANNAGEPDFFLNPQRNNLRQSRAELDLRRRVRSQASFFGEEFAFQQNPGISESRLMELLQGIDTSAQGRIADNLDDLNKLLKQGVQTVIFGTEGG